MAEQVLKEPISRSEGLARTLRPMILDGRFSCDEPLPSHRQLSQRFGEGVQVVRSALAILEEEGLVYSRNRQGTFVKRRPVEGLERAASLRCVNVVERVMGTSPGFIRTAYLQAYSDVLEESDVRLRISPCPLDDNWESLFSTHYPLSEQGCILVNLPHLPLMTWLDENEIPYVVQHNRAYPLTEFPPHHSIYINKVHSGFEATRHLLSLGHEHIGFIGTIQEDRGVMTDLYPGVQAAVACAGLQIRPQDVLQFGTNEPDMAREPVRAFLDRPDRPRAVVAQNDVLAFAVIEAAESLGFRVPEDVSVVGFDDVPEAAMSTPALTTMANPRRMLGRETVELLLAAAEGKVTDYQSRVLEGYLVVRDSTGAPA